MCDSGPTLSHKPLLGQFATWVHIEYLYKLMLMQRFFGWHGTKLFNKILKDSASGQPGMSEGMANTWTRFICLLWLCQWRSQGCKIHQKQRWSMESCWWFFHLHLCRSLLKEATEKQLTELSCAVHGQDSSASSGCASDWVSIESSYCLTLAHLVA